MVIAQRTPLEGKQIRSRADVEKKSFSEQPVFSKTLIQKQLGKLPRAWDLPRSEVLKGLAFLIWANINP